MKVAIYIYIYNFSNCDDQGLCKDMKYKYVIDESICIE